MHRDQLIRVQPAAAAPEPPWQGPSEANFAGFSYGFRPGRSPHQALDALAVGIQTKKVNWVLDADIRSFFDTLDRGWLVKFLEHRVGDRPVHICHPYPTTRLGVTL